MNTVCLCMKIYPLRTPYDDTFAVKLSVLRDQHGESSMIVIKQYTSTRAFILIHYMSSTCSAFHVQPCFLFLEKNCQCKEENETVSVLFIKIKYYSNPTEIHIYQHHAKFCLWHSYCHSRIKLLVFYQCRFCHSRPSMIIFCVYIKIELQKYSCLYILKSLHQERIVVLNFDCSLNKKLVLLFIFTNVQQG